jgi:hypothetical protein
MSFMKSTRKYVLIVHLLGIVDVNIFLYKVGGCTKLEHWRE